MPTAFAITNDPSYARPREALKLLQNQNLASKSLAETLDKAIDGGTFDADAHTITISENAVLLMMGITDDLKKAVAAAKTKDISAITTSDPGPMGAKYNRMKIAAFETDTLLAIASQKYWQARQREAYDKDEHKDEWTILTLAGSPSKIYTNDLEEMIERCRD